jgi:hypothetical protein
LALDSRADTGAAPEPEVPTAVSERSPLRTKIPGLSQAPERNPLVEGSYLARVVRFGPAGHAAKPCVAATFLILGTVPYSDRYVRTRLYCHDRALWKLRWFVHDFNYGADLLAGDDLDDRGVVGLEGVIRLAYGGTTATAVWMFRASLPASRRDQRVLIEDGQTALQAKFRRPLPLFPGRCGRAGVCRWRSCLIEWKTATQSYPENPGRMLELDPQLVCYSWGLG